MQSQSECVDWLWRLLRDWEEAMVLGNATALLPERKREKNRRYIGRILKPVYTLWILPQVCNWANSTIAFVKNLNCTFYLEETIFFTCISFLFYIEFDSTILHFVTELLTMYSWIVFNLRDKNLSGFMNISFICVFLRWTNTYGLGMMWGWKIIFTV